MNFALLQVGRRTCYSILNMVLQRLGGAKVSFRLTLHLKHTVALNVVL